MANEQFSKELKYSIAINYRVDKVRVHKQTIEALGSPRFIQFLINPDEKLLYIRGTNTHQQNCLEVPSKDYRKKNQYVLHGRYFIKKLSELAGWSLDRPHTIQGEYNPDHNMIVFQLDSFLAGDPSENNGGFLQ